MNDLRKRLSDFDESLASFKAETNPSWQTGEIFNALLAETKQAMPDDPIVRAIRPVEQLTPPVGIDFINTSADVLAGSLRAAVKQLVTALGGRPSGCS
jgi:hypothetical protein